jgi:hypothetical protein
VETQQTSSDVGARSAYTLWVHRSVGTSQDDIGHLHPEIRPQKIMWAERQLALEGRTPGVKGVTGHDCRWKRTPVEGNHFYLWWITSGTRGAEKLRQQSGPGPAVFVRAVRPHDSMEALDPGSLDEYLPLPIAELDPLYDDQRAAVIMSDQDGVRIRVIDGWPGSGKTVALQYGALWWAGPQRKVLYVTYTDGLADQAREFFQACENGQNIEVYTFALLANEVLGDKSANMQDRLDTAELKAVFQKAAKKSLGAWEDHPDLLWTEIRAYLVGMALPFTWRRGDGRIEPGEILGKDAYLQERGAILDKAAEIAHTVATGVMSSGTADVWFGEQMRARHALDALVKASPAELGWLEGIQAVIVDEIQDLTLVQIALVTEVARLASERSKGFGLIVAGDESQTVRPSGFDWGVTKDLLSDRLGGARPLTQVLRCQRRSPEKLACLIDSSRTLYGKYLPDRSMYPKLEHNNGDDPPEVGGALLKWVPEESTDWAAVLKEIGEYPGLAIVGLNGTAEKIGANLSDEARTIMGRLTYTPAQFKGLDRKTVLVIGLDMAVGDLERACTHWGRNDWHALALENRRRIDEMRVAISRSTETLVLVQSTPNSPGFDGLDLSDADTVTWTELRRHLRERHPNLDVIETIYDLVSTATESLRAGDLERARLQNDQALRLLETTEDEDARAQVKRQRKQILFDSATIELEQAANGFRLHDHKAVEVHLDEAKIYLQEAPDQDLSRLERRLRNRLFEEQAEEEVKKIADALEKGNLKQAARYAAQAGQMPGLRDRHDLRDRVDKLNKEIHLGERSQAVTVMISEGDLLTAFERYVTEIAPSSAQIASAYVGARTQEIRSELMKREKEISSELWKLAEGARGEGRFSGAGKYYGLLADLRLGQGEHNKAEALQCLAERYRNVPPPVTDPAKLAALIEVTERYLGTQDRSEGVRTPFAIEWLAEICEALGTMPDEVPVLRSAVGKLVEHPSLKKLANKEHLCSALENTVEHFRAEGRVVETVMASELFSIAETKAVRKQLEPLREVLRTVDRLGELGPAERETVLRMVEHTVRELNPLEQKTVLTAIELDISLPEDSGTNEGLRAYSQVRGDAAGPQLATRDVRVRFQREGD